MMTNHKLFTSESVTEGHPDKIADQISDAVLDAHLSSDPQARVAVETFAFTNTIQIAGQVTSTAHVDVERIARATLRDIGYTSSSLGLDGENCRIAVAIDQQSADIAMGVDEALETRDGKPVPDIESTGAGDQGMMFGFATRETRELMPMPIVLAHSLTKALAQARRRGEIAWLGPDGKSQVTVEYDERGPFRVDAIVISTQHSADVATPTIEADVRKCIIDKVIPGALLDSNTRIFINPTGRFVIGGPKADTGLTGRKIIADSYGGMARHGGGAFSGKDPTKVDRSAAYAARYVAKNIVASELAGRCEVQIAYAIGIARPISVRVDTFGTGVLDDSELAGLIAQHFDLRPAAIIRNFDLRRPIYRQTSNYGHFGRPELDLPWEKVDKVEALRAAAGLQRLLDEAS